ncbi:MAG: ABC transporter substrate-binding protein [Pelolinea sp.]|nr:ABC transporter substrate-binding protein [Pelolinea sp.]
MKKIILSLIISCILVSCNNSSIVGVTSFSVQDALGRTVEFSEFPERIVIAGKQTPTIANFFYLFSSRSDRLIAIENRAQSVDKFLSLIDTEYESKLILEKGAGVEQISPLDPDLVFLKTSMKEEIGIGLEEAGIRVVYVSFEDEENIFNDIRVFGKVLDSEDRAEELISEYQRIYSDINNKLLATSRTKNVLLVQATDSENGYTFKVPSISWLQTKMVEDLNATPVWTSASLSGGWTEVNIEQILTWDPDVVLVINYQGKSLEITNKLKENPIWEQFIAEKEITLEPFPYDYSSWDQPDTRWILGYAWIAGKLYPDEVTSTDMLDLAGNFYKFFYGMDDSFFLNEIKPLFSVFL